MTSGARWAGVTLRGGSGHTEDRSMEAFSFIQCISKHPNNVHCFIIFWYEKPLSLASPKSKSLCLIKGRVYHKTNFKIGPKKISNKCKEFYCSTHDIGCHIVVNHNILDHDSITFFNLQLHIHYQAKQIYILRLKPGIQSYFLFL